MKIVSIKMATTNRLLKEFKEIKKENDGNILIGPSEEDLQKWSGQLKGPIGTPYQDGVFGLICQMTLTYPLSPPIIKFRSKIFHPNVHSSTGEICLDILKNQWTPAWTLLYVFKAILILLSNPEHSSPLNCDAGNLLRQKDHRGYCSMAYMYTKMLA